MRALLQIEMAVTVDGGLPLVQATYRLEGDGAVIFTCYEELNKELQAIRTAHFPNLNRVAKLLSQGNTTVEQQCLQYGASCVQPAFDYFQTKFHGDLKPAVSAFKAAQLFCTHKVNDLQSDSSLVNSVTAFPFLQAPFLLLINLKAELPQYLACAADLAQEVESLDWWNRHSTTLPYWFSAASTELLVKPSSVAVEGCSPYLPILLETGKMDHFRTTSKPL